jgi:hypothetical protein
MGNSTLECTHVRVIITTRGIGGVAVFSKDAKKNPDKYLRVLICQAESRKEALELEALFVTQELVDDPMCYNLKTGGIGGSQKGRTHKPHSEETKKKMSAAKLNMSEESRAKMSASSKGKSHSDETKAKMSAAKKGKTHSEESKAKMSAAKKGKTHSAESKANMSAAMKGNQHSLGRTYSAETKAKLSAANKGKTRSEETKAKISAAHMRNVQCPHCEKAGGARVMHRWHFDNCKSR